MGWFYTGLALGISLTRQPPTDYPTHHNTSLTQLSNVSLHPAGCFLTLAFNRCSYGAVGL